ncbi:MAG: 4-hydroxy-3-methylbut-2-enyl diphosphate reductase [Treponema sp.]|nr:4-hydroxy-3-methylbut-2-enyl diphosphate reductase [Treponema sp.]
MKVIRADVLGFCMGVQRAVNLASAEAKKGFNVYTLGPMIHNPRVLADLKSLGVNSIDRPEELLRGENCTVIIRAHGIEPGVESDLHALGIRIADATCPNVKANQLKAEELTRAGYYLFLAGESKHAEIKGIMGYANTSFCAVVGNAREAGKAAKKLYNINNNAKTALLGQTTISEDEYTAISESIRLFFPNLEIIQTICSATRERQIALRQLLDQAEAVIIAGGRDSANTNRLLAIAQKSNKPCVLAEDINEIPPAFFNYSTIGLCAGASTPDCVIDEIERELINNSKKRT